jgi:hypothetical protein
MKKETILKVLEIIATLFTISVGVLVMGTGLVLMWAIVSSIFS